MSKAPSQPRPLSFYLALGVAVVCVVAVGFILVRAVTTPPTTGPDGTGEAFGGSDPDPLGQDGAQGLHIQLMDRNDRTRLSAELRSETLEPFQAQRYKVTKPRATMYLEDGRVVYIVSDTGDLVMPDRAKAPETGTLKGNVVVRLFDASADGQQFNPEDTEPSLVWRGSSLTFDATLGEASTNEPFVLTSAGFEFEADDAKVLINQTLERLERFTVRQGGTLVYFDQPEGAPATDPTEPAPSVREATQPQAAPGGAQPGTPPAEATAIPPRAPIETFYQAAMRDGIVLERHGQRVDSDGLDIYARTIDNKLPPNAIARFEAEPGAAPSTPAVPPASEQAGTPPGAAPPTAPGDQGEQPVLADQTTTLPADTAVTGPEHTTLTWTGVLEVRPLSAEPPELASNHLLARFTAEQSGIVSFSDAISGASGQSAMVEYGFTTQDLILSGPSQESSVFVTSPSMGHASMGRIEVSLATGRAIVPGPFSVVGADQVSRIDSRQRAELTFAVREGRLTGELLEALFIGSARAADAAASLKADSLHAYFKPDAAGESRLDRLLAEQQVLLDDGQGAGGQCDKLDTRFAADTDHPVPESFTADGNVRFRDRTGKIDSEHLHALLRETESGGLEVTKAWAEGAVVLARHADQIDITGERLFADTDAQYLEVEDKTGQARVVRGPTQIAGTLVQLNGVERSALVQGAGYFDHRTGDGDQAAHVRAEWAEGMAFDDGSGKLECLGAVEAVHEPDAFTRERIVAELVRVQLDPRGETDEPADPDQPLEALAGEDRAIRTVYAAGRAYFGVGEELAVIESARYASPLPEAKEPAPGDAPKSEADPALERAFRLSGVEILSDNQAGTLDVPGRGRLFVADLRPAPDGSAQADDRGAALFDWRGSLHADRNLGAAEMLEGVQMNHSRTSDGMRSMLESARLRINFAPAAEETEDLFGGLRSAIADTSVYLRTDARELTADLLEYDPDAGIARALGDGFNGVRILDRATGSPMSASAMIWNLTTDRVDIVDPGTITIAR